MKTLVLIGFGIYIGRRIAQSSISYQLKKREQDLHRRLDTYLKEHMPALDPRERQQGIEDLLKHQD